MFLQNFVLKEPCCGGPGAQPTPLRRLRKPNGTKTAAPQIAATAWTGSNDQSASDDHHAAERGGNHPAGPQKFDGGEQKAQGQYASRGNGVREANENPFAHASYCMWSACRAHYTGGLGGYRKILVRATNWVGDAVMSLPALRALREQFPASEIAILAKPWVADLYRARTVLRSRDSLYSRKTRAKNGAAARALAKENFDCAILLQNAFEAAAVNFHRANSGANWICAPRRTRGFLLTKTSMFPENFWRTAHLTRCWRRHHSSLVKVITPLEVRHI